jgi:2-methylisocitrate lyase-like PEP mutase family enzyme
MDPLTSKLQALLKPGAGVLIPGAANALTARIAEQAGFEVVLLTGAGLANTYLGVPDIGLTTATEVADQIAAIREATEIPIMADGDTGFGNALNVRRTVRLFERAGANLIQLEDQVFPKKCGHFEGKQVIPRLEMVQKIKAAVDARKNGMLVLARTDARAVEGLEGALERIQSYKEAGADVLFVEAPTSDAELAAIPKQVPGPHVCNMVFGGKTPLHSREKLGQMGYAGIAYANAALQASVLAMQSVLRHLKAHGSLAGAESGVMRFADRQKLVDHQGYIDLEKRYAVR